MNKLVVLAGVPGSGKSYFSKTIKKVKSSHVYVVSSDELRKEIAGTQSSLEYETLMWQMFMSLAKTYSLDKEGVVILDATHVNSDLRVGRNQELKTLFNELILIVWNMDKQLVSNQNLQRDYPIAPDILEKFFEMFELPDDKDKAFFDQIIYINNNDIAPAIEALKLDVDPLPFE